MKLNCYNLHDMSLTYIDFQIIYHNVAMLIEETASKQMIPLK